MSKAFEDERMYMLITTFISSGAPAFSAATRGSSVPPECEQQQPLWVQLVASTVSRLDPELRLQAHPGTFEFPTTHASEKKPAHYLGR